MSDKYYNPTYVIFYVILNPLEKLKINYSDTHTSHIRKELVENIFTEINQIPSMQKGIMATSVFCITEKQYLIACLSDVEKRALFLLKTAYINQLPIYINPSNQRTFLSENNEEYLNTVHNRQKQRVKRYFKNANNQ